jgi:hypothetical protein
MRWTGHYRPEKENLLIGHSQGYRHEGMKVCPGWYQKDGKEGASLKKF